MKCRQCDSDNSTNAQHCVTCGTSLDSASSTSQQKIGFQAAIRLGFQRYFDFGGRSTRAEYWWFSLFLMLSGLILRVVDMGIDTYNAESSMGLLSGLFNLLTLIPSLALGARRLHDINRTGWWQLMWLCFFLIVPIVVLIVWACKRGLDAENKYGPSLLASD